MEACWIGTRKHSIRVEGKLSDKEKHEVESVLADSAFMDDAAEGLAEMKDKQPRVTFCKNP